MVFDAFRKRNSHRADSSVTPMWRRGAAALAVGAVLSLAACTTTQERSASLASHAKDAAEAELAWANAADQDALALEVAQGLDGLHETSHRWWWMLLRDGA